MITVTGQTFPHRDMLKRMGGTYDGDRKGWQFAHATEKQKEILRALPMCLVSDTAPKKSESDFGYIISSIVDAKNARDKAQIDGKYETKIYGNDESYLNYFKDKNPLSFFGFSNMNAYVDYIASIPHEKTIGNRASGRNSGDEKWCGTFTFADALKIVQDGWTKGVEHAAEISEIMSAEHAKTRQRRMGVAGGNVSVGRMLAGNPAHMVQRPKQPGRKVITLFIENIAPALVKASNLSLRAALIGAMCDILERNGYSCEIISVTSTLSSDNKPYAHTTVRLKDAGSKLNLSDLMFSLGHPSFLRRLQFAVICSADELRGIYSSQGYSGEAFNKHWTPAKNEFYIKGLVGNVVSDDADMTLREKALKMFKVIKPAGLPIDISVE